MDKLIESEMINGSYKGLGMMCLLRVFLRLSGSPKWLFTVSEVEQGLKHDFVHNIPLWRDYVCTLRTSPHAPPIH